MAEVGGARTRRVRPGMPAPGFTLEGTQDGRRRRHSLDEHLGSPVVLVFYPADASPVCTVQLATYSADIARFAELDAVVLALSPQGLDEHEAFARDQGGFAFPLLSDVDREVAAAYDTLGPLGFYRRAVVVIDAEGVVAWVHRSVSGATFRSVDEIAAHLGGSGPAGGS